ncbi:MAG: energy transducer TonB [Thermoanaerobaculia bacterium]
MSDKKECIRCHRPIDQYARTCPYCNWDQNDVAVPAGAQAAEETYVPPQEGSWRKYALMLGAGIILLIGSFAVGSRIQGHKPVTGLEEAASVTDRTSTTLPVRPAQRAKVTLVPLDGSEPASYETPITSAPATTSAEGVPPEYQRSDATAVSSVEYAQLAARAQAEKKRQQKAEVDPRSLTGPAFAANERQPPRPQPQMSSSADAATATAAAARPDTAAETSLAVTRTQPVPEYQPTPDIQVTETTVVRLQLTVGADGRVHEVNVLQGIPGQTSKIISSVQQWRFKPATENGTPVSAPFTVDLSFRGNE